MNKKPPKYKSKFEATVGDYLGKDAEYEPEKLPFIQPAKSRLYIPDFKTKALVFIECKGKWTAEDRAKHVWVREQHPEKRIVLVFQNANQRLSKKSKTTYGEWATKNGFEWYDWKRDGIPKELIIENNKSNRNRRRPSRTINGTN